MISCKDDDCLAICNHCARCLIRRGHPHTCTMDGSRHDPMAWCQHFYCVLAPGAFILKAERWIVDWRGWSDEDWEKEMMR